MLLNSTKMGSSLLLSLLLLIPLVLLTLSLLMYYSLLFAMASIGTAEIQIGTIHSSRSSVWKTGVVVKAISIFFRGGKNSEWNTEAMV